MNVYRVSFMLSADNVATFLEQVGPHLGKMTVTYIEADMDSAGTPINPPAESPPYKTTAYPDPLPSEPAPKRQRAPRSSKVNDAILGRLMNGPAPLKELRDALVNAGLAAGSVSMGVKSLQENKQIDRNSHGQYFIVPKEEVAEAA